MNYRIRKGAKGILTKEEHLSTDSDRTTEAAATKLSRPVTRVSLIPWDKSLCIFCQKESSRETVLIMTIPVSEKILNASKHDYTMRVRTAGISDLIAADAIYHNQCRVQFERRSIRRLIENRDVHFPKSWEQFISSSENKANLATFLFNELMSPDVYGHREIVTEVISVILTKLHQPGDATLAPLCQIMKKLTPELFYMQKRHQIRDMKDLSCCKDTYVLLLLTFFANELCQEIWMQTGNFKSPKFFKVH